MKSLSLSFLALLVALPVSSVYGEVDIPQKLQDLEKKRDELVKVNEGLFNDVRKIRKEIDSLEGNFEPQALAQQTPTLGHPTVEQRIRKLGVNPADGYRFVMFGDQRSLWKKDFPAIVCRIENLAEEKNQPPLLFMVDTGDIVDNGLRAKQFAKLKKILKPVAELPYLVAVGNHELKPKMSRSRGRKNTATFLAGIDPCFSKDRMYYAKTVGPVRFLFLNSNDFPGVYKRQDGVDDRSRAQMEWLKKQLKIKACMTIALMHHPFIQSCRKHRKQSMKIWNHEYPDFRNRTFAEILIAGGVDLALTGHVHSYETFRLKRNGKRIWSLNVSGKPTGFFPCFKKRRMPQDWAGCEIKLLAQSGFKTRLDQWQIKQTDYMKKDERENQFAVVTVDSKGNLDIEVRFLKPPERKRKIRIESNCSGCLDSKQHF